MLLLLLALVFVDGAMKTVPINVTDFTVLMNLGTPSKTYILAMDLAVGFPWVFSNNCTQPKDCRTAHNTYNPTSSSTAHPNGTALTYRYAGGALVIDGHFQADILGLGPSAVSTFMQFADVDSANTFVFPDYTDGPLGLAYPTPEWASLSVVTNYYEAKVIDAPLFAIWANTSVGQLHLGAYDPKAYMGTLGWTQVVLNPFSPVSPDELFTWSSIVDDILVDGKSSGYCGRLHTCYYFIDPAAGGMDLGPVVPDINVSSDCSNVNTLPTYTFQINGTGYDLTPTDYVIKTVNSTTGDIQCTLGFVTGAKPGSMVFGTTWLRAFYSIFDIGNKIMGYARAATSLG